MIKEGESKNKASDVRNQLLKMAREIKRPSQEVLQYYAMERFLYRLSASRHSEKFVLKGGLLFSIWSLNEFRATQDIDFLGLTSNDPDYIEQIFKEVCLVNCNDGVLFDLDTIAISIIQPQNTYQGIQIKFKGSVDRSRVHMRVDIGFADVVYPHPVLFSFPTILEMPAPALLGYTQESVIAEKVDAMLQLGELNSRMKDFYDVWNLSYQTSFEIMSLAGALRETFKQRGTDLSIDPIVFQPSFEKNKLKGKQWINFCHQNRFPDPQNFDVVMSRLRKFMLPVLDCVRSGKLLRKLWNSEDCSWKEI